jgi:hypothetical protein
MPVEISEAKPKSDNPENGLNRNLILYDDRVRNQIDGGIDLGHNGFVILGLNEKKLEIRYYDDNKEIGQEARLVLTENWEIDISTGKLNGTDIRLEEIDPDKKINLFAKDINRAIQ